jgi:hypothetical protein
MLELGQQISTLCALSLAFGEPCTVLLVTATDHQSALARALCSFPLCSKVSADYYERDIKIDLTCKLLIEKTPVLEVFNIC